MADFVSLHPWGNLAMSGDIFDWHVLGKGCYWHLLGGSMLLNILHLQDSPTIKNYPAQNVKSTEFEKPCCTVTSTLRETGVDARVMERVFLV